MIGECCWWMCSQIYQETLGNKRRVCVWCVCGVCVCGVCVCVFSFSLLFNENRELLFHSQNSTVFVLPSLICIIHTEYSTCDFYVYNCTIYLES